MSIFSRKRMPAVLSSSNIVSHLRGIVASLERTCAAQAETIEVLEQSVKDANLDYHSATNHIRNMRKGAPSAEFMAGFKYAREEAQRAHDEEEAAAEAAHAIGKRRYAARMLGIEEENAWDQYSNGGYN